MPNLKFGGLLLNELRELSCACFESFVSFEGEEDSGWGNGSETRSSCNVAAILGTWFKFSSRCVDRGPLLKDQR